MDSKHPSVIWKILAGIGAYTLINANVLATSTLAGSSAKKPFTEVRLITPFTAEGINPLLKISKTVEGNCWATSMADSARPNTWRCQAEQVTYDPCFLNQIRHENTVICITNPWENKAVKITLTNPLPTTTSQTFDQKSAQPWALELANGNQCTLITGPSLTIAGMTMTYQCKKGTVVGSVDRDHKQWTALFLKNQSLYISQTPVRAAWY